MSSVNQDPTETYMLRDLIISTRQAVFFGGPAVKQFSYYFLLTLHFSAFSFMRSQRNKMNVGFSHNVRKFSHE